MAVNPVEYKKAIRKVYADAKKKGEYIPAPQARAIAYSKISKKKK